MVLPGGIEPPTAGSKPAVISVSPQERHPILTNKSPKTIGFKKTKNSSWILDPQRAYSLDYSLFRIRNEKAKCNTEPMM